VKISFGGQVALVTGAASGLGLATANAFAESGASVVLADVNEQPVQQAAKKLACSSAASYITGQSISVDGGWVMRL
jgi:NAD(P)-dependent dehydrogenase (short-subunit alcohol dehydrogenase family)